MLFEPSRPSRNGACERGRAHAFRRLAVVVVVLAALVMSGCAGSSAVSDELVVTGSTTILPIAEIAAEEFADQNPSARVLVSGVGSSAGIESVSRGSSDIGTSSRDLKPQEEELGLYDTAIAVDAIAVVVNPDNPVDALTSDEVRSVFAGEVSNWSEVGGPDWEIGLVNRDEASGTREAFYRIVMGGVSFDRSAAVLPGTGQVRSVVANAESAIGYVSLGFVTSEVKVIRVDGVMPTPETVRNGRYPLQRKLHFFTVGEPEGLAKEYVDFVLSEAVQEGIVRDAGFLPIAQGVD
ncbi:MAG: phosphate ABC transporter substrate-binding protein [Coriobacteriia bacterium]|nr:phosphate ABC transporter substrate-binding protein [Coriobacteriia bacterium]